MFYFVRCCRLGLFLFVFWTAGATGAPGGKLIGPKAPDAPAPTSVKAPKFQRLPDSTIQRLDSPPPIGYGNEIAFETIKFTEPVAIASPPGETNRLFVLEKPGRIMIITNLAAPDLNIFLDLSGRVFHEQESGLLGIAFHPQFMTNRFFYIAYTFIATTATNTGIHWRLARFEASSQNPNIALPDSELPLITQYDEDPFHESGDLHFGPDGYLYVSVGDEGSAYNGFQNAQVIDKDFFSGILRIDVDKRPGSLPPNFHPASTTNYAVPPDNPFINATSFDGLPVSPDKVRTEFYAVGLRNPWRFSFDPETGDLYSNDTGQSDREEIDLIVKGGNYGWPYHEGTLVHTNFLPAEYPSLSLMPPIAEYSHTYSQGDEQLSAIAGGLLYRGNQIPGLNGAYIFSDFWSGKIGLLRYAGSEADAGVESIQDQITRLETILNSPTSELETAQIAWERSWQSRLPSDDVAWTVLDPVGFDSAGGASLIKQPDLSLLAEGVLPWEDTYTITAQTDVTNITEVMLELLPDDSLPDQGPGRSAGGNSILSEFQVSAGPVDEPHATSEVVLKNPIADYSQTDWEIAATLDGDTNTGWGILPQVGQPHQAVFETPNLSGFPGGTRLTFTLKQNYGYQATIGRFRILIATRTNGLPNDIADILNLAPENRTDQQRADLAAYYRSIDPSLQSIRNQIAESEMRLDASTPDLETAQLEWENRWLQSDQGWITLDPLAYTSANGASLIKQPDNSLLAAGIVPWDDVYSVVARTDLMNISAVRLEVLPDDSLPNHGPGRAVAGNIILSGLYLTAAPADAPLLPIWVNLTNPSADYSQPGWDVSEALHGTPQTGWAIAPLTGQAHQAVFETPNLTGYAGGTALTFFVRQVYGNNVTIGRFRISVTTAAPPPKADTVPPELTAILRLPRELRDDQQNAILARYYRGIDPNLQTLRDRLLRLNSILDSFNPGLDSAQADREERWAATDNLWHVLDPNRATSASGVTLAKLADFSLLAAGATPWEDTYTVSAQTDLTNITALRLELLPDESLPGYGPGRTAGGNIVLSEFQVIAASATNASTELLLSLTNPSADYSQPGWPAEGVIDGDLQTGWAIGPLTGRAHQAVFEAQPAVALGGGTMLTFLLRQNAGNNVTVGRFRISVTSAPPPVLADKVPDFIAEILRTSWALRTGKQKSTLAAYYGSIDPAPQNLKDQIAALRKTESELLIRLQTPIEWIARQQGISSFGINPATGDILMADLLQGILRRVTYQTNSVGTPLPPTLADTGVFSDVATLTPNPGVWPYSVNVPFWSDNAIKTRWFSMPDANLTIAFNREGNWSFPPGTVWIKHFDLELTNGVPESTRRIETRLLIKNSSGVYGLTYRWNDSATNAFLVPEDGLNETFLISDGGVIRTQVWHYPSRNQCLQCHTAVAGYALGFNTAQLNRDMDYSGVITNQLLALSHAGYFDSKLTSLHALPALARSTDTNVSLEYRVRSYLHANCVQCHQPGGSGSGYWDARITAPTRLASLIESLPANSSGDPEDRIVKPGSPDHSILLQRIAKLDARHMPPLATTQLNTEAIDLLSAWITNDLPNYISFADWQLRYFASTNSPQSLPSADPDNDGAVNYTEYLTKTDPLRNDDVWKIAILNQGNVTQIKFPRLANLAFELQWTTNLFESGSWQTLEVPANRPIFSATDSEAVIEDTTINQPPRYYRVIVDRP
ncbi:MAG: PQQ-dependent sugar dehydrogenase [Verrucomicrobiota bacterium]